MNPITPERLSEIEKRCNDPTLKQLFSDEMFDVLVHTSADLRDCVAEIKRLRDGIDRFTKVAVLDWEENKQLRAKLADVTAQYQHCHSLYSERIECTDKLGRLVESLQAQLATAALQPGKGE